MRKLLLSLLALLFLASCSEGNGEKIAVEDFEFSDWNDFLQIEEAVPLEENEECVLSVASKCLVGKEKLFFWDYKQKRIFSFGRDGRYLGLVGDCGHAANEYSNIKDIQFSPDSTIVQVLDNKGIIYYRADDDSFIKCEKPKFDRIDEAEKFIQISDDEYLFFNPKSGECLIKYANGEATVLRTANTIQMSCEKFYRYGGETKNLSEGNMGYDMDPVFSPDGKKLVWWSMETDGFESDKHRLVIYDFKTQKMEDYSKDFDQDATNFSWSEDGKKVYFNSVKEATYQIYSLDIANRKFEQLTTGDYDYNTLQVVGDQIITTRTTHAYPSEIYSVNLKNKEVKQLSFINKDILDKVTLGKTVKKWVPTTDGKKMLVWVILPPNFDSTKTYPTLLYCEGGPQSPVSQFYSYRWNFQMMAAHDYIVVAPNRRGLPGFGQEWNDAISKDYGGQCMRDYLSAIDAMAKEPYVDEKHLGCVGASFGGFSVYWLAGHHEKRFKAFIAHCGMFNFESWYNTTEELFFANHDIEGAYWKNPTPKSYDFSPHKFVGNWDTPILVIHGGNDFRIPYTEGMQAFDVAQMRGIPSRFLYFPDECHFVTQPQNAMLWQREFFRWLDQWLKDKTVAAK